MNSYLGAKLKPLNFTVNRFPKEKIWDQLFFSLLSCWFTISRDGVIYKMQLLILICEALWWLEIKGAISFLFDAAIYCRSNFLDLPVLLILFGKHPSSHVGSCRYFWVFCGSLMNRETRLPGANSHQVSQLLLLIVCIQDQ